MASPWTPGQLCDDLRRLGIEPGDVVMVHASLRAIGPVDGGAAGVVAALDEAVGPSGTLLMTLGARDDWSWVNEHAEDAHAAASPASSPATCRGTTTTGRARRSSGSSRPTGRC